MEKAVTDFLLSAKITTTCTGNRLFEKLQELGVNSLEDLKELELSDLSDTGLTVIAQRKLIRVIKEQLSSLLIDEERSAFFNAQSLVDPSLSASSTSSVLPKPKQHVQEPYYGTPQKPQRSKIYYIFCKELFKRNVTREVVGNLDLGKDPLELVIRIISERHKCSLEKNALEFYSQEGYPLCMNQYNVKFTLAQWKFENESLFYIFVRPRVQPVWIEDNEEIPQEPLLDPKKGPHRVKIYSQLYGTFIVNADLTIADLSTLKSKISSYTGLPLKYIHLYRKADGYSKIMQDSNLDVADNDTLVLRIECFPMCTSLTKKNYIPTQIQTDRGYAKFYTILIYMISTGTVDHQKFVSAILKFSCCPPLAYAFQQLFQHKSIVVLFEGFFQLSESILGYFCNDVQPENCFEFSDYIFGLFLKFANAVKETSKATTEKLHLQCPISNRQILIPVMVPQSDSVYESRSVEDKIRSGLGLVNCTYDDLQLGDIRPALNYERFLMYKAFFGRSESSNIDFDVWKNIPPVQKDIPPVIISCTWKDLNEAIKLLAIKAPDALASMKYCITYIEKGQFAFYSEPAKSVDQELHVYDPIKDEERLYSKSIMSTIATDDIISVCHKLTDFLNPKILKNVTLSEDDISVGAIGDKQELTKIKTSPGEAIMVLIDCSGSMCENIFVESGASRSDQYSKLTAAKELFFSFANRTDAYGFNHVIGLITFSSSVSVKVEFTQIMDHFKEVVSTITTSGQTALHTALSEATDRLIKLTKTYPECHRRILCLTDGEDNCSKITAHEITRRLQREKIVVDTVLISATGNVNQKAISHASGGFCFMPSNLREATRLFEMEVLLRLQDRSTPFPTRSLIKVKKDLEVFQDLIAYPYNSTNPYEFKTNFASGMDEFVSSSAKKMVNLASFMGQSSGVTLSVNDECVRRIVLEAKNYIRDPHVAVEIFPGTSNVLKWKILLKGPDECPYEGGIFLLLAKFPTEYPSKPPEIRFVTPIYHCNINSSGRICHPILGRNYVPSMTFRSIIDNIYGLLMAPEPLDPLDSVLASQYHDSREVYEAQAVEHTEKYAKKIGWNEMKKELTEDEDLDVAEGLVCPLTNKLFVDPVSTPHGFTYERDALLDYLKNNGNRDPLAHRPVRVQDLVSQRNVKRLAEELRKSNFYK